MFICRLNTCYNNKLFTAIFQYYTVQMCTELHVCFINKDIYTLCQLKIGLNKCNIFINTVNFEI